MSASGQQTSAIAPAPAELWPQEVDLILSAMEAGGATHDERRKHPRVSYRTVARLRLFSDAAGTEPWKLYTRDVSVRGVGFITEHRLPLGYGGMVELAAPRSGRVVSAQGTLFRC